MCCIIDPMKADASGHRLLALRNVSRSRSRRNGVINRSHQARVTSLHDSKSQCTNQNFERNTRRRSVVNTVHRKRLRSDNPVVITICTLLQKLFSSMAMSHEWTNLQPDINGLATFLEQATSPTGVGMQSALSTFQHRNCFVWFPRA